MSASVHNLGNSRQNLDAAKTTLSQAIVHRSDSVVGSTGHGDNGLIPILKAQNRNGLVYGPQHRNAINFGTNYIGIIIKKSHHLTKNLFPGNFLSNHLACKTSPNYVQFLSSLPNHNNLSLRTLNHIKGQIKMKCLVGKIQSNLCPLFSSVNLNNISFHST